MKGKKFWSNFAELIHYYEILYKRNLLNKGWYILEKLIHLKIHWGLGFLSPVIIAIIFSLGVDPTKEKL